ncbi:MAG: electron transfer flavoprotein subunit alpha/FixB family protein [Desulfobacula sp.]|nr:electron transfer flavoprotein subunit alpha/FixB family protein [Desulfobacula sp.]
MGKKTAIIAEHHNGEISTVTYELLALAKGIQESEAGDICFFILGADTEKPAQTLSTRTGEPVHAVCIPGLAQYNGALYKKALSALFSRTPFDYILAPHSSSGMDYAPALSMALGGSCITGVKDVVRTDGALCFVRSLFGGKLSAKLTTDTGPLVLTLQPGALKAFSPEGKSQGPNQVSNQGTIERSVLDITDDNMVYAGTKASPSEGSDLARADVIVSGGRGIRDAQNYNHIEMLARLFPRSATGGSRPICDYKWIPYSKQVGITGTTVSPKLYIACGISGAPQHVEGMKNAGFIVAVNTDPDAPVFQIADVCIVEDLMEFIPFFIETFKQKRRKKDERNDLGESFLA